MSALSLATHAQHTSASASWETPPYKCPIMIALQSFSQRPLAPYASLVPTNPSLSLKHSPTSKGRKEEEKSICGLTRRMVDHVRPRCDMHNEGKKEKTHMYTDTQPPTCTCTTYHVTPQTHSHTHSHTYSHVHPLLLSVPSR